jgi:hypothetical protein
MPENALDCLVVSNMLSHNHPIAYESVADKYMSRRIIYSQAVHNQVQPERQLQGGLVTAPVTYICRFQLSSMSKRCGPS